METTLEIIKPAAAEDIGAGDYVAITRQTIELLPYFCDEPWKRPEPQRVRVMPGSSGYPLRVVRVCVPFVLVRDPRGRHFTLDLRRYEVAKLAEAYGRKAFKCFARDAAKETAGS